MALALYAIENNDEELEMLIPEVVLGLQTRVFRDRNNPLDYMHDYMLVKVKNT